MKTNMEIILEEAIGACLIFILVALSQSVLYGISALNWVTWNPTSISQGCFELNNAIVIAFIITIMINGSFKFKGRKLTKIAGNSIALIITNSIFLVFCNNLGIYSIVISLPALYGNCRKVLDISKYILDII